ncbi:MAG: hypothetical protein HPY75_05795 [Actinobacteria bacterium]|nr:hypothetical protein [Actinomycetota bacterium]
MEIWRKSFERAIRDIMWSQWSALGAYVEVEPCRKALVDPEAILVATCALGRDDARIFDEAMDWTVVNHRLLRPWRMRRISRSFGPEVTRTLGAVLEYVSMEVGAEVFPGVRDEARGSLGEVEVEELFRREKGLFGVAGKDADTVFARWKLLRGAPRIRRHSGTPDRSNPANLMLRLRDFYGSGARADVMTYLLTEGGGSSNGIATKISYRQGQVYRVLENLVSAGIAHKRGGRGNAHYWIDREAVAVSLGLEGELPAFFAWGDVFLAFHLVASDWERNKEKYADDFLAAERMRDLAARVVPLLGKAGGPLSRLPFPVPGALKGMEHARALMDFLQQAADILQSYMQ